MTSSALFRYIFFVGVCGSVPVFCVSAVSSHIETERSLFCFFAPEPFQSHKLSSLSHWQPELDNERIAYSGRTNRRKLHCVCSVSAASLQTRVLSLLVLKCAAKTLFSLHKSCPHSGGEIYIKKDYSFSKRSSSSSTVGGKMFASHAHSREHSYVGKPFLCGEKKIFFRIRTTYDRRKIEGSLYLRRRISKAQPQLGEKKRHMMQ